jgi:hypothetical protein
VNGRASEQHFDLLEKSLPESGMALFPNPASGELTVVLYGNDITSANLSVFDLSGKIHLQYQLISSGDNKVKLDKLPTGLYFVAVTTKEGLMFRQEQVIVK